MGGCELMEKEGLRLIEWDMYLFRIYILNFGRGKRENKIVIYNVS